MELKEYRLGDVADIITGVSYSPSDITTEGIRILRGGNVQNGNILCKEDDVFLPLSYADKDNQIHRYDTVIVSSTGSIEALAKAATCFNNIPNTQIGAFLRIIRPKKPEYAMLVSMWCTSQHFRDYIINQAKGTSINNIRTDFLTDYTILMPQYSDLQKISNFYLSINEKISLCREMNRELEGLARQIYQYWFLQFQYPNATPQRTYNPILKHNIPDGWQVKTLGEVANITMGQSPAGESYNSDGEGLFFYQGSTDFGERFPKIRQYTTAPSRFAKKGDILMSVRAPVGDINIANNDCCIGRGLAALNSKTRHDAYLYYVMQSFKALFDRKSTIGTTFGSINKEELYSLPVLVPTKEILDNYEKICKPMFDKQMNIGAEISVLTHQRDSLLPLLMNGQVVVD
jgi:type I restriction enzyme, S subunit